ncbi:MAG: hypothetical protein FWH06_07865, partial [Oscillospiraceae bacterium]|nr:hypothetical protein [Oscillospiraceae bacterium]
SEGRDGVKIKLVDRQKSLAYIERQKQISALEQVKLDLELLRLEISQQMQSGDTETSASNFFEAMTGTVADVWSEDDDKKKSDE